jgi:hypothetical protein
MSARTIEPARYLRMPDGGLITIGGLAASDSHHQHMPDLHTGSSCRACFGWQDDPATSEAAVRDVFWLAVGLAAVPDWRVWALAAASAVAVGAAGWAVRGPR